MLSTMQDFPLTVRALFDHGRAIYPRSQVVTATADGVCRVSYGTVAERVGKLANALRRLGIRESDRVATFGWNTQEHLEAYMAVPSMGSVLHMVNIRLFAEQIAYIINHAEDRVVLVDDNLIPTLAPILPELKTIEHLLVIGDGDASALGERALRYEEVLAAESPDYAWPEVDERSAAGICYTSGTTGNPKGVVYSHRSTFLHALGECSGEVFGLSERDRVMPVVPMFHANAWGFPYSSWMVGADQVMPSAFARPERLAGLIRDERVTVAGAVPTVWFDLMRYAETNPVDLSSIRMILCGGAAVPRALIEAYEQKFGVSIIQGWGLTETSPLASMAYAPKDLSGEEAMAQRSTAGRPIAGIELRLTGGDGSVLPWDGVAVGEIEVRGPWVTAAYSGDPSPEKFHDGWLRTGDVGSVDHRGYIHITDRAKDVIKSGGEWISTLELEAAIVTHPAVAEVAVVTIPDERWGERPLACVVLKEGQSATPEGLRTHLADRVVKWWIPEYWTFIDAVPRTSVGKFDKKVLRARQTAGELQVQNAAGAAPTPA